MMLSKLIKNVFMLIGIATVVLAVLILRPVPTATEEECIKVAGVVTNISGNDNNHDITFKLKANPVRYYINRGMEAGLNPSELNENLTGKEIIIMHPKYWTPLDPKHKIKHISKVTVGEEIVFTEID